MLERQVLATAWRSLGRGKGLFTRNGQGVRRPSRRDRRPGSEVFTTITHPARDLFQLGQKLFAGWGGRDEGGQEKAEEYPSEREAGQALAAIAQAKRRRGYQDL